MRDAVKLCSNLACALLLTAALPASARPAATGSWSRVRTTGSRPSVRSTPAVAALGKSIYLFGGVKDDFQSGVFTLYNDLYRFDTASGAWEKLAPRGESPSPRAFLAQAADERRKQILFFGGATFGAHYLNYEAFDELWSYSVERNEWTKVQAANQGPSGRARPSAWLADDRLYVFGGILPTFEGLNDLWSYDLNTNRWTQLIPDGAKGSPPPRYEAATGAGAVGGKLLLYGGESINGLGYAVLGDTWEFDLKSGRWSRIHPAKDIQPPRNYAAAALIGDQLFVQGGDLPGGSNGCGAMFPQNPTNELWRYDLSRQIWSRVAPGGERPPALKRSNAAAVGSTVYIFSGFDFHCPARAGSPAQMWNQDVFAYEAAR